MPASEVLKLTIKAQDQASAVLKSTASAVEAQALRMQRMGTSMMVAGAAVAAGIALAVRENVRFGKSLAFVGTMLNQQTMSYLPAFRRGLLDMSIAAGESTDTLARGLYNVLSASIPAEKAMKTLKVTVDAATAGMTDTSVAAFAITGILNAYGLSADKARSVSDALFTAVKRGQTTFAELAPTLGRVTSISASAKVSFDEVAAALATITRGGVPTDIAVTALASALDQLQDSSKETIIAADGTAISFGVLKLAEEGLGGMISKLSKLSSVQIFDLFQEKRARIALNTLIRDQTGFMSDLEAMQSKTGATAEALALIMETLSKQLERAKAAFKALLIEGSEPLEASIKRLSGLFVSITEVLIGMPGPLRSAVVWMTALATVTLLAGGAFLRLRPGFILAIAKLKLMAKAYKVRELQIFFGGWKAFAKLLTTSVSVSIGLVIALFAMLLYYFKSYGALFKAYEKEAILLRKISAERRKSIPILRFYRNMTVEQTMAEEAMSRAIAMRTWVAQRAIVRELERAKASKKVIENAEKEAEKWRDIYDGLTKAKKGTDDLGKATKDTASTASSMQEALMGLPEAMGIPSLMEILKRVKETAETVGVAATAGVVPAGVGGAKVAPIPVSVKVEGEIKTPSIAGDLDSSVRSQLGGAGGGF